MPLQAYAARVFGGCERDERVLRLRTQPSGKPAPSEPVWAVFKKGMTMATKRKSRKGGKWMKRAFSKNKGKFTRKAAKAGMSTQAFARKESGAPGTLGKEARLARLGAKISKRSAKRKTKRTISRRKKRVVRR